MGKGRTSPHLPVKVMRPNAPKNNLYSKSSTNVVAYDLGPSTQGAFSSKDNDRMMHPSNANQADPRMLDGHQAVPT